jgi:hypothetical protein
MARINHQRRSEQGSVFLLVALCAMIILTVMAVLLGIYSTIVMQKRGTDRAECFSLTAAQKLDDNDRIGQMNNMESRCRELVYLSRQDELEAGASGCPIYQQMSEELLQESRNSASTLDSEYTTVLTDITEDCRQLLKDPAAAEGSSLTLNLPWLNESDKRPESMALGYARGVDSNVYANTSVAELLQFDRQNNLFADASVIFRGNVDAKLPGADSDLHFRISSLPAPVDQSVTQTHVIDAAKFVKTMSVDQGKQTAMTGYLPSAVEYVRSAQLTTKHYAGRMQTESVALSHGASQPPPS